MQTQTQTRTKVYTVTQVNSLVKDVLQANLPSWLTIKGEITDWKQHQSGHCYFCLKDEESVLPCAMWRGSFSKVKFKPGNGLAVLVSGSIDLYVPQGRYKLIVDEMIPAGMGALQLAFEQMVRKLEAEGLFSPAHKKPLPKYPQRIGILTSESGAAVHDIADSIYNRWPCTRLALYPVPVQGPGAAEAIAAAIRDVNRRNDRLKLDVLIVGRGGGSLEDLWAFNEEVLARAIFESRIPIISAVGHEVDVTVADLVADARASTPTKAGVVAVPDMEDVLCDSAEPGEAAGRQRSFPVRPVLRVPPDHPGQRRVPQSAAVGPEPRAVSRRPGLGPGRCDEKGLLPGPEAGAGLATSRWPGSSRTGCSGG